MKPTLPVLFRVAAGPRIGFGHLLRCRALARALDVEPVVSLRGCAAAQAAARAAGLVPRDGEPDALLGRIQPAVLIVDDPSREAARPWVRAARRAGVPLATVRDSGIGAESGDLVIDGSASPGEPTGARWELRGPRCAVLAPSITSARQRGRRPVRGRILIALGGGRDVHRLAAPLCADLARVVPDADLRVAAGFVRRPANSTLPSGAWIAQPHGLAAELRSCEIAVVGGGVTLLEACALGVPAVALAVTDGQQMAIDAVADAGAVICGGPAGDGDACARVAAAVGRLRSTPGLRGALGRAGAALVDGDGAARVAAAIRRLIDVHAHGAANAA